MAASSESGAGTEALACSICRYDCQMGYVVVGAVSALGFGLWALDCGLCPCWLAFYLMWQQQSLPKLLTGLLCMQILGMRHNNAHNFFLFFFLISLLYYCPGRIQPQHINFRTDIGHSFLQAVDAVVLALCSRTSAWLFFFFFLHWYESRSPPKRCRLIEMGAWPS